MRHAATVHLFGPFTLKTNKKTEILGKKVKITLNSATQAGEMHLQKDAEKQRKHTPEKHTAKCSVLL